MLNLLCSALALATWGAAPAAAPTGQIDFSKLRLNQLAFTSSRSQVQQRLGQPRAVVAPHYECGAYSSQEQGQKFYQLRYPHARFIGNNKVGYAIQYVYFVPKGPALTYGRHALSDRTTVADLQRLFGPGTHPEKIKTAEMPQGQEAVSVHSDHDDGAIFWFSHGRLTKFEYWTPC
ncbi:hypothetical protein [Hymenobacter cheonanensis]|uniref:hypothetical protein n=1 Tax=Hymenobacter sp. CA2-7 TaxID=3063993 RepID=UPI0027138EC6|nr:hypothetical protein [Hymenobacter sp. CA2-7]MDO7886364.1 hypothetical protein [Hymenobacter sp. CA2-7]